MTRARKKATPAARTAGEARRKAVAPAERDAHGDASRASRLEAVDRSHGVVEFDRDGRLIRANEKFLSLVGFAFEEIAGRDHRDFIEADQTTSEDHEIFWSSLRGGAFRTAERRVATKDGGVAWLRATYAPVTDDGGEFDGVVVIAADLTTERRRSAVDGAKIAALGLGHAVVEFDLEGRIRDVNENFVALMGYTRSEVIGRPHSMLVAKAEARSEDYRALWAELGEGLSRTGRFRRVAKNGGSVWADVAYSPILDADGAPAGVFEIARDVTAEVEAQTELARRRREHAADLRRARIEAEKQTLRDPLTNLANRRSLDLELEGRLKEGEVVLISVDLDRFKQVNDVLGHDAGDYVLRHVARTMNAHTRKSDLVARVGGDEFMVLCAPGTKEDEAVLVANRMLNAILQPVRYNNKRCVFGASLGVASCDARSAGASEVLSYADAALYKAKRTGREKVEVFTPELMAAVRRDRRLAEEFVSALSQSQIVPYVQTQHSAEDWSLVGVEVLARWDHPEHGVLTPDCFLHVARQLGMEPELDAKILESALVELDRLEKSGVVVPRVSFNVSAGRILAPEFADTLARQIRRNRSRFAFEILETVSYPEYETELAFAVDSLRELGFQIDIDDFGAGHASINSILSVAPDSIKIDRHIIEPLGRDPRKTKMVALVVEIARVMDVRVTAEGVETRQQAELLRDFGCDRLQGFFFSRPMPMSELETFKFEPAAKSEAKAG